MHSNPHFSRAEAPFFFRLEMQTHNCSISQAISVIFSVYICDHDSNVIIIFLPIIKIYWRTYKNNAVMWHLLAGVTSYQAISLHPSLAGY